MEEIFKDIKYYENLYQISNLGRVKSLKRIDARGHQRIERIMRAFKNKQGYLNVRLFKDGKHKNYLVSRLVALHFIPNINNLPQINHKDGIKANNRVENLEWATRSQNMEHAGKMGLIGSKLTQEKVRRIKELADKKITRRSIAGMFGISSGYVTCIVTEKWEPKWIQN